MRSFALFLLLAALTVGACSDRRAEELFDTAQFEERQRNVEHAKELYQEIVSRYGDTPYAKQAEARLHALEGMGTK